MKCFTLGLFVLFISFGVQAAPNNTDSKEQGADNSQNDRQFSLPSGPGAIPVNAAGDNEAGKQTNNNEELSKVEQSAQSITENSVKPVKDKSAESIKEKWGVGEFIVRQTSAGYMLDVRYRVFDKEKAKPLFSRKLRPFAIEEASGVKYGVPASPKVGFLRQAPSHIKENKEYFLMIANPGKRLKSGDKLTLVIGDFRIEHLTIE